MAEGGASRVIILIAVDASEEAWEAFVYYRDCLHKPDNTVRVLHCIECDLHRKKSFKEFAREAEMQTRKSEEIRQMYQDAVRNLDGRPGTVEVQRIEKVGKAIVEYAYAHQVTMVMMGTRGLGLIRRTILGSVSHYVLDNAHCSVAVYKKPKQR